MYRSDMMCTRRFRTRVRAGCGDRLCEVMVHPRACVESSSEPTLIPVARPVLQIRATVAMSSPAPVSRGPRLAGGRRRSGRRTARRHPSGGGAPDGATIDADSDPARRPGMTQRLQPETTAASTPLPPSAPSTSPRATRTAREEGAPQAWSLKYLETSWSGCRGTQQIPTRR